MRTALATVTALLFLVSMGSVRAVGDDDDDDDGGRAERRAEALERALASKPEVFQFTNLNDISADPVVAAAGGAFLIRSKNGVTARVMAADLEPGHAYTFWWLFFNKPSKCAQKPCSPADFMAARGAVHYGSGAVAGAAGEANVTFSATSGGPPEGAAFNPNLPERGLVKNRGFTAEIHLVLIDHGIPDLPDLSSDEPNVPGTWAWELTHALPPGPTWVRGAVFEP